MSQPLRPPEGAIRTECACDASHELLRRSGACSAQRTIRASPERGEPRHGKFALCDAVRVSGLDGVPAWSVEVWEGGRKTPQERLEGQYSWRKEEDASLPRRATKSPAHDHERVVGRIVGDIVGRPENRSPLSPQYPFSSRSQGHLRVSTRALLSDTYRNLGSLITQRSLVQIQPPQPIGLHRNLRRLNGLEDSTF